MCCKKCATYIDINTDNCFFQSQRINIPQENTVYTIFLKYTLHLCDFVSGRNCIYNIKIVYNYIFVSSENTNSDIYRTLVELSCKCSCLAKRNNDSWTHSRWNILCWIILCLRIPKCFVFRYNVNGVYYLLYYDIPK